MRSLQYLYLFFSTCLFFGSHSCKKEKMGDSPVGISRSFTEEFENVYVLEDKGWVFQDHSEYSTAWIQPGGKNALPFPAYSYTTDESEYIAAFVGWTGFYYSVSSWLITPVLSVKNGDRISFYTRTDTAQRLQERMQVRMNGTITSNTGGTTNSVGDFSSTLIEINPSQAPGGYPAYWSKFEYTFSGISGRLSTRIGFRYVAPASASTSMIGLDRFRFESN